jgi:hypothetical protein
LLCSICQWSQASINHLRKILDPFQVMNP